MIEDVLDMLSNLLNQFFFIAIGASSYTNLIFITVAMLIARCFASSAFSPSNNSSTDEVKSLNHSSKCSAVKFAKRCICPCTAIGFPLYEPVKNKMFSQKLYITGKCLSQFTL